MDTCPAMDQGRKSTLLVAMCVLLVAALSVVVYWLSAIHGVIHSDDARLGAHIVDLAPEVSATLRNVYMDAGDRVKRGQRVFDLDPRLSQATLSSAEAAIESAKAGVAIAEIEYQQAISATNEDRLQMAKAAVDVAKGSLAEKQTVAAKARLDVERTTVAAPFDGWVVRRWLDPGAMVQAGRPVVTVFDPSTLRVDANIEEKDLDSVAVGDEVDISVDAFPKLHLVGRVEEILRATNSQFSLIPAEGVSGTYVKMTQRVPLRISVKTPEDLPIGPGLSVEVKIRIGSAPPEYAGTKGNE